MSSEGEVPNSAGAPSAKVADAPSSTTPQPRRYLKLHSLSANDLPPHPDLSTTSQGSQTSLADFLNRLLDEAKEIDFENGFTSHGTWTSKSKEPVSKSKIEAEQRTKRINGEEWVGRRSYHSPAEWKWNELDEVLGKEHSVNECRYTPSVYDAVELLRWSDEDLYGAVRVMKAGMRVERVEMTVFQMFHRMPTALGGLIKLQDRVFHVLVVTFHSQYQSQELGQSTTQIDTLQIPMNFESFQSIESIARRSRAKLVKGTWQYDITSSDSTPKGQMDDAPSPPKGGAKLTEGHYVSLERIVEGRVWEGDKRPHVWDMITLSDAGGISKLAPAKKKVKETLSAVAEDVEYVLNYISKQRKAR